MGLDTSWLRGRPIPILTPACMHQRIKGSTVLKAAQVGYSLVHRTAKGEDSLVKLNTLVTS